MKIYHYTSIETLALILQNKTIRFTRLDHVDDPEEYSFTKNGYDPSKYVYVSCWTKSNVENIPQWIMYGNNKQGIRIGLDSNIFQLTNNNWQNNNEIYSRDYMIMPALGNNILHDINYVDNMEVCLNKIFQTSNSNISIVFPEIAKYKNYIWSFQKECRFVLCVFPKEPNSRNIKKADYLIQNNIHYQKPFIDIPLKSNAFDAIEITLGPEVSTSQEIIVSSLLNKYTPGGKLIRSKFQKKKD